jgi:SAM-dependent methyltransferase
LRQVLGFAVAVTDDSLYEAVARRGIERVAESDSVVLTRRGMPLVRACNELLDEAARIDGLTALVMLHQDTELCDAAFAAKVRARLADPEVAIVGALGVRRVRSGAMWMPGHVGFGRITEELFGVERVLATGNTKGAHEVDAVDGFLLVLSPWAIRNLRFDPAFDAVFHSYDLDLCFQARARGKKVVVEQIDVVHRRRPRVIDESLKNAATIWRRKWSWDGSVGAPRFSPTHRADTADPAAPPNPPYERLIAADRRRATALQEELIGRARRVLELDRAMAEGADDTLESALAGDPFDVVIIGGVLGRFRRPEAVLKRVRPHLAPGGFLLVRLPNPAHVRLRTSSPWARGERASEPADGAPLPLTRRLAIEALGSAGYRVGAVRSIEWDLGSELGHYDPDRFSTEMLRLIVSDPDARAVEHLIVAYPAESPAPPIVATLQLGGDGAQRIRPLRLEPEADGRYGRIGS